MSIKIRSLSTGILLAALVSSAAWAVEPGFYMGVGVGATKFENAKRTLDGTSTTISPSNTGTGERFFMGYEVTQYVAMEMGFDHYGPSTYKVPAGSGSCGTNPSSQPIISLIGFDFLGKGMIPISSFKLFGKAGFVLVNQGNSGSISGVSTIAPCGETPSDPPTTSFRPELALGVSYDLSQNWVADLSYSRVMGGGGIKPVNFAGLSITYHFVSTFCGQFLC